MLLNLFQTPESLSNTDILINQYILSLEFVDELAKEMPNLTKDEFLIRAQRFGLITDSIETQGFNHLDYDYHGKSRDLLQKAIGDLYREGLLDNGKLFDVSKIVGPDNINIQIDADGASLEHADFLVENGEMRFPVDEAERKEAISLNLPISMVEIESMELIEFFKNRGIEINSNLARDIELYRLLIHEYSHGIELANYINNWFNMNDFKHEIQGLPQELLENENLVKLIISEHFVRSIENHFVKIFMTEMGLDEKIVDQYYNNQNEEGNKIVEGLNKYFQKNTTKDIFIESNQIKEMIKYLRKNGINNTDFIYNPVYPYLYMIKPFDFNKIKSVLTN